jgi:hypothetical protein
VGLRRPDSGGRAARCLRFAHPDRRTQLRCLGRDRERMTRCRCRGFCHALQPRRDVDAISKNVMGLDDDVADIDARESDAVIFRSPVVSSLIRAGYPAQRLRPGSGSPPGTVRCSSHSPCSAIADTTTGQEGCQFGVRRLFIAPVGANSRPHRLPKSPNLRSTRWRSCTWPQPTSYALLTVGLSPSALGACRIGFWQVRPSHSAVVQ